MQRCADAQDSSQPNIVFIMADDLGYGDLGCYGQTLIETPNIDRLAADGIRFTQAYAGGPVCAASRAVLMTGLHNGHAPARDNVPHYPTYLQDGDVTLAEVLQDAGYRTAGVGKWSLGDAGTVGAATRQGFDRWFGYLNQDHAHYYYPEYLDDDDRRFELLGNGVTRDHYSHDLMADRALTFIEEAAAGTKPFFLYAAFTLPHFSARSEDSDRLAVPSTAPYSDRDWDEHSKKYAAMIHRLDRDVGRIVNLIDQLGIGKKTLIVFTSDNGGHSNTAQRFNTSGELRGFKRDLTEGGIRVPLIACWQGKIPGNVVSQQVIAFQDMLPTLGELAGATIPKDIDGISVVRALMGDRGPLKREYLYWDYGHCRSRYDQAVRWKDWKAIRLGQSAPMELYDLGNDVDESNDVAREFPDVVMRMQTIMDSAVTPSERYPIGQLYNGKPIWKVSNDPSESE